MKIVVNKGQPSTSKVIVNKKNKIGNVVVEGQLVDELSDLNDVNISSATEGDTLIFDGSVWKAEKLQESNTPIDGGTFS